MVYARKVGGRSRSRKYVPRKVARASYKKKTAFKPKYKKTQRVRKLAAKSQHHTVIANSFNDDGGGITGFSDQMKSFYATCAAVMSNLLIKSPRYFNLAMGRSFLPLGSADPNTLYDNILTAVQGKHIRVAKGLDAMDNNQAITTYPGIDWRGISIKLLKTKVAEEITDVVFLPMCYYQFSGEQGMRSAVFANGRLYLKFPRNYSSTATGIVHMFPVHLCIFNCANVKFKVYYSPKGQGGMLPYKDTEPFAWPKGQKFLQDDTNLLMKSGDAYLKQYMSKDSEMEEPHDRLRGSSKFSSRTEKLQI